MNSEIDPPAFATDRAWELTRSLMNELVHPAVDAIRISLVSIFDEAQKPSSYYAKTVTIYRIFRLLFAPGLASVPAKISGGVLAVLPAATPSSVLNLGPVLAELSRRGVARVLVMPEGVDSIQGELGDVETKLTFRQICRLTTFHERLGSIASSHRCLNRMLVAADALGPGLGLKLSKFKLQLWELLLKSDLLGIACQRLLSGWRPCCVVSTSDLFPLEYQMFAAAKSHGVPTLLLQHGVVGPRYWPFFTDSFIVWGASDAKSMVDLGAPAERIHIGGMPASDRLSHTAGATVVNAPGRLTFVMLSNMRPRSSAKPDAVVHAFLKRVLVTHRDHRWLVRLHPTEGDAFYRSLGEEAFGVLEFLPKSMSFQQAVENADVCCTVASTAGLEAMLLQKPLIVFSGDDWTKQIAWWPNYGGGISVASPEELRAFIHEALTQKEYLGEVVDIQNKFLARRFKNLGRSASAVSDFVQKCMESQAFEEISMQVPITGLCEKCMPPSKWSLL